MFLPTIIAMFRALWLWLFIAVAFGGLVLVGAVHGPWNYYWFFAMGCWFVLDAYWSLGAQTTKPFMPRRQFRQAVRSSAVVHLLYCLPLSAVPVVGQQILPHFRPVEIWGASLCAIGTGFAIWARCILAENWNAAAVLQKQHVLVRTGPYAIVRHPIYFGFLLLAFGMFLALGEVRGLVCLGHAAQFFPKMTSEEDVLRTTYPAEYPDYERKVKRLVPYLW